VNAVWIVVIAWGISSGVINAISIDILGESGCGGEGGS
jgi:hypothetical protein